MAKQQPSNKRKQSSNQPERSPRHRAPVTSGKYRIVVYPVRRAEPDTDLITQALLRMIRLNQARDRLLRVLTAASQRITTKGDDWSPRVK